MLKSAIINDIRGATTLAVLGAVLVPIAFVFVLFSTPRSRQTPIFWIQCFALALAMAQAAIETSSYHIDIETNGLHPQLFFNLCAARESLKWITPWVTDCALVFKILYFYPRTLYSRKKQVSIGAFPALIKVPRLVVIIINLVIMCRAFAKQETTWASGLKFQVAEIAMQVADNSYCSSILLYKSWKFYSASSGHVSRTARAQRRARHIVESIAMSFVPALCIQIAFLVVQAIPGDNAYELLEAQNYLFIFNVYVSLIFSILATSWSSICNVAERNRQTSARMNQRSLQSSAGSSGDDFRRDGKRSGGSSSGGGTTMEKELPEHRTLLQYLTSNDDVEELMSVSEDGHSYNSHESREKNGFGEPRELERGGMHSNVFSLPKVQFGFATRRKASSPSFTSASDGVIVQQERLRATSPRAGTPPRGADPQRSGGGSRGVPHLNRDIAADQTRVAPFTSPQVVPFRFQEDCDSSKKDSRGDVHPSTNTANASLHLEQDAVSLDDMLRE
ncbi:hypothetical protein CBS101457_006664 [Exobasidium rhododendri]|nr:hypothetical protein CBS101457_006664 [Exobasidium rhododendri]